VLIKFCNDTKSQLVQSSVDIKIERVTDNSKAHVQSEQFLENSDEVAHALFPNLNTSETGWVFYTADTNEEIENELAEYYKNHTPPVIDPESESFSTGSNSFFNSGFEYLHSSMWPSYSSYSVNALTAGSAQAFKGGFQFSEDFNNESNVPLSHLFS
jgi:hypothetical protein